MINLERIKARGWVSGLMAIALLGGGLGGEWLLARAAEKLGAKQARELIQGLGGAALNRNQVEIRRILPGTGDNVIVEAQVETAFRFARAEEGWRISEVRLGDRNWESVELIEEALRREKARRTSAQLSTIAESIDAYRRERGRFVVAADFTILLDHLSPQYLAVPQRFDLWGTPLIYEGTAEHYRLASNGPDRAPGTGDDIVLEDGRLRTAAP